MACEVRTMTFTDPDGTIVNIPFSRGVQGFYGPPIELSTTQAPGLSGSFLTDVRHGTREIAIPVYWKNLESDTQLETLRDWIFYLDPSRGDGTLKVTNTDATERQATVRLNDGWNLEEIWTQFNEGVLVFQMMGEPYWEDGNEVSGTYDTNDASSPFFPFFPLSLSSSTVFATWTEINDGDVKTWPRWTLEGPGSDIYIRNLTTDKVINLSTTLLAGETITIDTRPNYKTIEQAPGQINIFSDLSADSSLWSLERGNNSIQIEMNSADANSNITINYRRRWLSA